MSRKWWTAEKDSSLRTMMAAGATYRSAAEMLRVEFSDDQLSMGAILARCHVLGIRSLNPAGRPRKKEI